MTRATFRVVLPFCCALALGPAAPGAVLGQVRVVNLIPNSLSNETQRDSEPNLAVNPADPRRLAASAFTPDPLASGVGPIFVSTDGGTTWVLNTVLPGGDRTGDVTIRFGGTSNKLYGGILRFDNGNLNILRKDDVTAPGAMTVLVDRANDDQPYVQAATVEGGAGSGADRVYVPSNDTSQRTTTGKTASVDESLDAATAAPPAGFGAPVRVEPRPTADLGGGTGHQDGPSVRVAIHPGGTIYGAYFGWRTFGSPTNTSDVVVVRDDNWGSGATPFRAITDTGDLQFGVRVVTNVQIPSLSTLLGTQRIGSQLTIAVDPRNPQRVYLAWCDGTSGNDYTVHLRRSDDGGRTWPADRRAIVQATNPALAVNIRGRAGLLYQKHTNPAGGPRWETHLELSDSGFDTSPIDTLLANVPDSNGSYAGANPIGDYAHLLAVGKDFHGVFSGNNTPDLANFPNGVTYQRNADFTTKKLRNVANTADVNVSIDPFYFQVTGIAPSDDLYVRDWTDGPGNGDTGLEPSTHSVFYLTSDVWNRRGTLPGPFPNDQPDSEPVGNGAGAVGDNFAFARVRRNELPAGGSKTVTAHFLVSKLGTGSNYADSGSIDPDVAFPDPDPTVTFGPTDLGPLITPAYHWHLNPISSTHLCLAVEISAPGDPFVPPSLVGQAPGWPTTDLRLINDNNKAQRNIFQFSTTPARGEGFRDSLYAILHNAATFRSPCTARPAVDPHDIPAVPPVRPARVSITPCDFSTQRRTLRGRPGGRGGSKSARGRAVRGGPSPCGSQGIILSYYRVTAMTCRGTSGDKAPTWTTKPARVPVATARRSWPFWRRFCWTCWCGPGPGRPRSRCLPWRCCSPRGTAAWGRACWRPSWRPWRAATSSSRPTTPSPSTPASRSGWPCSRRSPCRPARSRRPGSGATAPAGRPSAATGSWWRTSATTPSS
jgi:hypothetical protein